MSNALGAEPHKKNRKPQIHTGIFVWFISFSLFIIGLLWILQIFFLDDIYLYTTRNGMQSTASSIAMMQEKGILNKENLVELVENHRFSVAVHKIEAASPNVVTKEMLSVNFTGALAENITAADYRKLLASLYERTAASPSGTISFDVRPTQNVPTEDLASRLVYAFLHPVNGVEYLTVIDTELVPIAPTVALLRFMLSVFTGLFILLALVLAYIASRSISSPLVRISRAAKALPSGSFTPPDKALYREIDELSDTLGEVAEELKRSERFQNELIANVSHDLRTPLTTVIGYSEVMRDFENERTPENCQLVIDEARRLTDFVQDLLTLSRIQAGAAVHQTEVFDLDGLLSETVDRYRRLKGVAGFTFTYQSDGAAPINADKTELSQVICNLLNNAVNYSGDSRRIEVYAELSDTHVTVKIRDFGIGIPKSELPRIFDRYYKVDKTHERARVGSGIGLAIVKRILESYGADYGAESELHVGSLFRFSMPLHKEVALLPPAKEDKM